MVELRLWHLSLHKHAGIPDGIQVSDGTVQEADRIWEIYGQNAEEMIAGTHDLTPPRLMGVVATNLLVHDNHHGMHKIDLSSGRAGLLWEPPLKYSSSPGKLLWLRLPEDTHIHNTAFTIDDAPPRLYYILRWCQNPTQITDNPKRELVGAGVSTGISTGISTRGIVVPISPVAPWRY